MEKLTVPDWFVSVCVYGFFVMSVVWFIVDCFFEISICNDEGYMAFCCRDYARQPMAMLTFYGGWLAIHWFGNQIIILRLLMCFCLCVGVGVPCWYCYRRTGSLRWTLFIASCVVVYVLNSPFKLYGWDFGPLLYAGPLITLLVSLYDRITFSKVIGIGCLTTLTILARIPSAIIVVPVCFLSLWGATKGMNRRGLNFRRYAGIGLISFLSMFVICVMVMKGSLISYFESWRPENIINGHGLRDIGAKYYDIAKYDLYLIFSLSWISKYAFASIFVLAFFSRRSRYLPALILLCYLFYRKLMIPNCMSVPRVVLDLIIILFPFLYNYKSRLLGENTFLPIDNRKLWTIIIFVLALSIGSDRIILRANFYYMLPLLLVPLCLVRRGMIFWILLFLILPSFVFSLGDRLKNIHNYKPMENIFPHHNHIYDLKNASVNIYALRPVIEEIKREGKRYAFFGEERFIGSYLYEDDIPYRLNIYHVDYKDEMTSAMDDFLSQHDCIVVRDWGGIAYTRKEMRQMMEERNFYVTANPGDYVVFERLQPEEFLSITGYK